MSRVRRPGPEKVSIPGCTCEYESWRAILVTNPAWSKKRWVPKSVLHESSKVRAEKNEGTLVVQAWWAEREGLL